MVDITKAAFMPNLPQRSFRTLNFLIVLSSLLLITVATFIVYRWYPYFSEHYLEWMSEQWRNLLLVFFAVLLIIRGSFFIYNLVLFLKYKLCKAVSDELLPTCTILVPAYNEGQLVYETLMSLAASDYPKEKIQLIAIDDGSVDDTWHWITEAKRVLGDFLITFQQPENKGKRHALYRGFNVGTGEIFITVDSDSVVTKNTLRNMASPFVRNPHCGAVAGNVRVLNKNNAIIPKMLNVSFSFGFEFMRSAQSVLGSVLCTPGALSAYRRDAVLNCLPEWIHQTFRGELSDIGEDRAMTNMIMKQGYHILFQKDAYVYTNTPERYKGLYKMFIRWERSNVRENIMMSKFAFKNFRDGNKLGTRLLLLNQWLKLIMSYPITILMFAFVMTHPVLFACSTLSGILIASSPQAIFYAVRHKLPESLWAYTYSIFYTFSLFWITPYAIATAGKKGWLTRG